MKGSNTLSVTNTTLIEAIQEFFDNRVFRQGMSPKVVGINVRADAKPGGQCFDILIESPDVRPEKPDPRKGH